MSKIFITLFSVGLIFIGGLCIYVQGQGLGYVPLEMGFILLGILIGVTIKEEEIKDK